MWDGYNKLTHPTVFLVKLLEINLTKILVIPLAMMLYGCQVSEVITPVPNTPAPTVAEPTVTGSESVESNVVEMTEDEVMETPNSEELPLISKAKKDLAERLAIGADEIETFDFQFVEWPDSSLGCPQPGMMYAQVLQDGMFIQLKFEGNLYNYHSGGGRDPFLCEQALQNAKPTPIELDFSEFQTPTSEEDSDN